jgi:Acetyl-CoA hydrolase
VQFVVTEYGIADLRGKSIHSRIESMIAIANSDHREWLVKEAMRLYNYKER